MYKFCNRILFHLACPFHESLLIKYSTITHQRGVLFSLLMKKRKWKKLFNEIVLKVLWDYYDIGAAAAITWHRHNTMKGCTS